MSNEESKKFTFTWKIKNYNFCFKKHAEVIKSPEFTAENLSGTRWHLEFFPKGDRKEAKEHVSCFLYRSEMDSRASEITVDYSLEIISPSGECWTLEEVRKRTFKHGSSWGFPKFHELDYFSDKILNCSEKSITIRCTITNKEGNHEPAIGCNATSDFDLEVCSFLHNVDIENLPDFTMTKDFAFPNTSEFEVNCLIIDDQLEINICELEVEEADFSQMVYLDISLLDNKGNKIKSKCESHFFEAAKNDEWNIYFVSKNELGTESHKLLFEFRSSKSYSSDIENYNYAPISDYSTNLKVLQDDLRALYLDKKHPDVNLKINNEVFPAHKAILAARSPVFHAMFNQDMLENQTSNVCISDTDPTTLSSFLMFLYTGTFDNGDYETTLKLLILADKYEVPSLKEKCSSFLISIISVENVCEILHVAGLINRTDLKNSAIEYIIAHATIVLPSPEWGKWIKSNLELATEVFFQMSANFGTETNKI